ncbi:Uncharacterized protein HZ326_12787 [Fusarium oxysporum f. sp. albedinis]|nr:Uncharacterized protein HZ326_12787 [Fusarium oxysporum f. sp. albedinis]
MGPGALRSSISGFHHISRRGCPPPWAGAGAGKKNRGEAWNGMGGNSAGVGTTKDETFIEGTNINLGSNCASYAQLGETRGNETSAGSPQPLSSTQVPA